MNKLEKIFRGMICALPAVLFFSYWPVISLGANEMMNFEFSLPLIWLIIFDVLAVVLMIQKKSWREWVKKAGWKKWAWLLFPIYLTLSVCWSENVLRGVLTVGILWLIYLAGFAFYALRNLIIDPKFRTQFLKWFFGSGAIACIWCLVQCILDLVGMSQEVTLLCDGCVYEMFGFPHPNGWAIEPQFMGNLLLAPALVAGYLWLEKKDGRLGILFGIFVATIFLTFSRGAIYALIIGIIVLTIYEIIKMRKKWALVLWPVVAAAFLIVLNVQGIFAQVSTTDDNYGDGVAKVVEHLSLGIIPARGNETNILTEIEGGQNTETEIDNVEMKVENAETKIESAEIEVQTENEKAVFDGYVEESTETRLRLSGAAITVWSQEVKTILFGVGIGGAGAALYENGLSPAPKEIVQNEYVSLLLETGIVGVALAILTLILIGQAIRKTGARGALLALLVAYGVTLLFFSGLPNALHIYLMPAILAIILENQSLKRKKLVS